MNKNRMMKLAGLLNEIDGETFNQKSFDGKTKPTTKEEVESILKSLSVKNYTINPDLTVDVAGGVDIRDKKLKVIPVNFRKVSGDFHCPGNDLTTLEGAPNKVGGDFNCSWNRLTTLESAPKEIGGNFWSHDNNLTTLEGAPNKVPGDFRCHNNILTTLKGAPKEVGGHFYCYYNKTKFTESDVKSVSNVKGKIVVK